MALGLEEIRSENEKWSAGLRRRHRGKSLRVMVDVFLYPELITCQLGHWLPNA